MTMFVRSTLSAKRSGTNFIKAIETLHGSLVDFYFFLKFTFMHYFEVYFVEIGFNYHRMLERRRRPSRNKILPITCGLVGVMIF